VEGGAGLPSIPEEEEPAAEEALRTPQTGVGLPFDLQNKGGQK